MSQTLKRMIAYYGPYKRVFWIDMFFAMLQSVIALIIPLVVRYITGTVLKEDAAQAMSDIRLIAVALVVLVGISAYSNFYIAYYGHVMGARIEFDMRADIFAHFQKLSFSFYDDQKVGGLMSRITNDLFDITELMHHGPENIVITFIKIFGAFLIMINISPLLTAAAFALIPIMFFYAFYFNGKMKKAFRRNRERIADINGQIEDNLSGIRVVKSFANEDIERKKFEQGNRAFLESKRNSYKYMGGYHSGLNAFIIMITVVVVVGGAAGITAGSVELSDLVTFLLYVSVLTDPVRVLIDFTEQFQNGYTGFERFCEILDVEPDITDKSDAKELDEFSGVIDFSDVGFSYQGASETVLSHVDLHVDAGEYVALVGPSGAGKTTLCSLIPRFYDVTEGSVKVDGFDVRDLTMKSLRDHIGIVQQDVYLFVGTVYDNILYGRPDATREEVIQAAKNANAHDFIMSLPDGYDTDIGQRGVKLSGGQKQRLSIARVFLKNPPILIFDEATSALDNESEKIVQESMEKLAKNRTTLVIAHRLSTIRNAGRILVLTEKGIEEQGSHEELLAKGGIYAGLYRSSC